MENKRIIGFTTTIPVEIIFAGGHIPCDLNNIFITDPNPMSFIERAERDGFPKSMCNWVKGIYGVVMEKGIDTVIAVVEGDCSNSHALAEILQYRGVRVIPFSYPYGRDKRALKREIEKLMEEFSVDRQALSDMDVEINKTRVNLEVIDRMTWHDRTVTGQENHLWLVRASDMLGDYSLYNSMAQEFIEEARKRKEVEGIRLGYIGIPPIFLDLHEFLEGMGVHVVFNETQRQYYIPFFREDLLERYYLYTYPYDIFFRIDDIRREIERRKIKGIIHYVQAFCHRVVEDVILRESFGVPIITVEGDLPRTLDGRTKLRVEAFVEMLSNE